MELVTIIEQIKKHGITGILCICLWWMNNRLSDVEEKLYDCLTDAKEITSSKTKISHKYYYAILPDRFKIKQNGNKRKMEG